MAGSILIVDDDPDTRAELTQTLEAAGYEVRTAADGADGLVQLSREPLPTLVLLDVLMPRMDGYDFMAEIERRGLRLRLPVWVLSGSGYAQQHAFLMQADGYLDKPPDTEALLQVVMGVLG